MNGMRMAVVAIAALMVPGGVAARDATVRSAEAAARIAPADGGATIELANAYRRDGRSTDADAAYRRALVQDNVMLETRLGTTIWSHDVARRALARRVTLAAR